MTDLLHRAIAAHKSGNLSEAEKLYRAALEAEPGRADARYNLGLVYGQLGRPFEAVREISEALQAKPEFGQGWFMLAEFADAIGNRELNCFAGEQAVRLMPEHARAWLRYGLALSRAGRDQEALDAFRRAVSLDDNLVKGWVNLCVTAKSFGLYDEAENAIMRAFSASNKTVADESAEESDEASYSYMHWHLALLELLRGDYRRGFAHARARFYGGTDWKRLVSDRPLWRGDDLRGKTIFITLEQGFGDMLMMARYFYWLKADGARVIVEAHPAVAPLFQGSVAVDEIVLHGRPVTVPYDYHAAIFDLPRVFGTTLENIPASVPYLPTPDVDDDTILPQTDVPRVGVVWAGQADNIRGRNRTLPLELFKDIFSVRGFEFFSLTRDKRAGDAALLRDFPVTDLGPQLTDFAVTARYIGQMDLIITCDTSVAHLAGGMGKKVWTFIPFVPDWRWALGRDDNAWYPTMRLFRQTTRDAWGPAVADVKTALEKWANHDDQ